MGSAWGRSAILGVVARARFWLLLQTAHDRLGDWRDDECFWTFRMGGAPLGPVFTHCDQHNDFSDGKATLFRASRILGGADLYAYARGLALQLYYEHGCRFAPMLGHSLARLGLSARWRRLGAHIAARPRPWIWIALQICDGVYGACFVLCCAT